MVKERVNEGSNKKNGYVSEVPSCRSEGTKETRRKIMNQSPTTTSHRI